MGPRRGFNFVRPRFASQQPENGARAAKSNAPFWALADPTAGLRSRGGALELERSAQAPAVEPEREAAEEARAAEPTETAAREATRPGSGGEEFG